MGKLNNGLHQATTNNGGNGMAKIFYDHNQHRWIAECGGNVVAWDERLAGLIEKLCDLGISYDKKDVELA